MYNYSDQVTELPVKYSNNQLELGATISLLLVTNTNIGAHSIPLHSLSEVQDKLVEVFPNINNNQ